MRLCDPSYFQTQQEAADGSDPALPETVAATEAERQIGRPVRLDLDWINGDDDWVFLMARMVQPDGSRFDFTGTYLEEAAAVGGASDVFCALLQRKGTIWVVVESCLGATDVVWDGWHRLHGLPESIFWPPN